MPRSRRQGRLERLCDAWITFGKRWLRKAVAQDPVDLIEIQSSRNCQAPSPGIRDLRGSNHTFLMRSSMPIIPSDNMDQWSIWINWSVVIKRLTSPDVWSWLRDKPLTQALDVSTLASVQINGEMPGSRSTKGDRTLSQTFRSRLSSLPRQGDLPG